ncbi:M15 family metallopeptidase [Cytobacillus purgationiresistens]|uniref:D-alanyl-D-alanine dipeptidase n=1 Tax=Cytobacillus purgationiresistens TaxID=863449 RepID=A0ABU0ANV7_9BACI|nr:M15 family metallopeptidase [Cytobacillus purgationiresistens]MDQ0272715.1 D-alanyl-D-alanine dipeptidase [Cytobacillus purgationiresistens]
MLIPVSKSSEKIQAYPYYYHMGLPGAENECYLREEVLEKLLEATQRLPEGISFVILDGWRSYETQSAIYEQTKLELMNKGITGQNLEQELYKYVATPSTDISNPSPHLTGGAIDLTLANQNGWLPMGSEFDEFNERSRTDWFENKVNLSNEEIEFSNSRKLLTTVMLDVGFISNADEWWHFEYGTKYWARENGRQKYYKGILRWKSE